MDLMDLVEFIGASRIRRFVSEYRQGLRGTEHEAAVSKSRRTPQGPWIQIGTSPGGRPVQLPWTDFGSHGLILGATGSGKTWAAVSLVRQIVGLHGTNTLPIGAGILDAKGDLFERAHRACLDGAEHQQPVTLDFGAAQPTAYGLLKVRDRENTQQLIERRMEVFDDVLGRDGQLSLRMSRMLRNLLALAAEREMPFPLVENLLDNGAACRQLSLNLANARARAYFAGDFERELPTTGTALRARLDFLLRNDALRLSFGASRVPDLTSLMDSGRPVLLNTGGPSVSRQITRVIQSLLLSDIRQAVFVRRQSDRPYVWFIDEAQSLMTEPGDIENLTSLLTMARSFGGHVVLITQSLVAVSPTKSFLRQLETNSRWMILLRCSLDDAELLGPAMPVTNPIIHARRADGVASYLTGAQEQRSQLYDFVDLPARTAYFWMRGSSSSAVKVQLPLVAAGSLDVADRSASVEEIEVIQAELDRQIRQLDKSNQKTSKLDRKGNLSEVIARLEERVGPSAND